MRLAVRAPFTHFEWSVGLLGWLGGTLKLPEPFGLRSAWASKPWNNRFMADDAIRVSVPVLRAAHAACWSCCRSRTSPWTGSRPARTSSPRRCSPPVPPRRTSTTRVDARSAQGPRIEA
ncbi:hypothetical protein ACFQZC_06605 [Streptacidiphilus monticola]